MKEEADLKQKIGTKEPFGVPDGYFRQFTSQLMEQLPPKEVIPELTREPTRWQRIRPWAYMAAMFVGAALIIRVGSSRLTPGVTDPAVEESEIEYISEAVDNAMMDDYSLYVFLADYEE